MGAHDRRLVYPLNNSVLYSEVILKYDNVLVWGKIKQSLSVLIHRFHWYL